MTDLVAPPALKKDTRQLAVGLSAAAALLLVAASFTHAWLVNGSMNVGFSLLSLSKCAGDACDSMSNFEMISQIRRFDPEHASAAFAPMGVATMALCLVGAIGLALCAYLGFAKKRVAWPVAPATIALLGIMGALITGCVFIASKPGGVGAVGVGWSFWAFGIGSVAGIAGAQMLNKLIKPVDPDLAAMNLDGG